MSGNGLLSAKSVHHIGIRVPDMRGYQVAIETLEAASFVAITSNVPGYHRTYFLLAGPHGQQAGIYLEIQCFQDGRAGAHVDIVEGLPGTVANALARVAGQGVIENSGEPSHIVPIVIENNVTFEFDLMARSPQASFWTPQSTGKE